MTQASQSVGSATTTVEGSTDLETRTVATARESARLLALDFTKGTLVLIMVLYHWVNYFVGFNWPYYRYLRFLTPSFIFVTGFLISKVYLLRGGQGRALSKRVMVRAAKLFTVFIVLNAGRFLLFVLSSRGAAVVDPLNRTSLAAVFVFGDVSSGLTSKIAAFYILVPISYLLALSSILIPAHRAWRYAIHASCALCVVGVICFYASGYECFNLELVVVGLVGALIGMLPMECVNRAVDHPLALAVAYGGYVVAITVWNVPFPLLIIGVCLSVGAIYWAGLRGENGGTRQGIILLGKYSLFGYIGQIAILQALSASLKHVEVWRLAQAISFVGSFALTIGSVEVLDRLRLRSTAVDRAYRAVFA